MTIQLGIDVLLKNKISLLKNKKVALLSHAAAVNSHHSSTLKLFWECRDSKLTKIFAPEHGFYSTAQDMETVEPETDPLTGLHVISLYGKNVETLAPQEKDLADIDVFVCDLQDVGSRYYTFIYTMVFCMEACAKKNIPFVVLDRPNPLNGNTIEGNILDIYFRSFVGWHPLPVRHGMTIGELAQYFNQTQNMGCDLIVIKMRGWKREMSWEETGLAFIPPSPNMPSVNTALVYPGMCLIEATELSEGRGTTRPFEWIGAPFIQAHTLCSTLNKKNLPGVFFRPIHFTPQFQKHAQKECHGFHLHVTDRNKFKSYKTGLEVLNTLIRLYPDDFKWREKAYEFVDTVPAIDLLTGTDKVRRVLENRKSLSSFIKTFEKDEKQFKKLRKDFLLY